MAAFGKIGLKPDAGAHVVIDGVADGYEAFVIAKIAAEAAGKGPLIYVLRDGQRMADVEQVLGFIEPGLPILQFPAWDCLPYDRVSPSTDVSARRLTSLASLIGLQKTPHPAIILTTANALIQRVPPADFIARQTVTAQTGGRADMNELTKRLELNGFERVGTVRDVGEYAVRGGILDIFAPGADEPVRLDFFGDTLESIRAFDPATPAHDGAKEELRAAPDERGDAFRRDGQPLPHPLPPDVRRGDARRRAVSGGERKPPLRRHGALAALLLR